MRDLDSLERDLHHWNAAVREGAAAALGRSGEARFVPSLLGALREGEAAVRAQAAAALGRLGDPRAVVPLSDALRDRDAAVACQAAGALGALRDPRAVLPLCAILGNPNADVRQEAASVLAGFGQPAVRPLSLLLRHQKPTVRTGATVALSLMGAEAVAGLCEAMPILCEGRSDAVLRRMRVAAILALIACQSPCPELRRALRPLRRWASLLSSDGAAARESYRTSLRIIEGALGQSGDLPVPASAPLQEGWALPRPADTAERGAGTRPRAAHGEPAAGESDGDTEEREVRAARGGLAALLWAAAYRLPSLFRRVPRE